MVQITHYYFKKYATNSIIALFRYNPTTNAYVNLASNLFDFDAFKNRPYYNLLSQSPANATLVLSSRTKTSTLLFYTSFHYLFDFLLERPPLCVSLTFLVTTFQSFHYVILQKDSFTHISSYSHHKKVERNQSSLNFIFKKKTKHVISFTCSPT